MPKRKKKKSDEPVVDLFNFVEKGEI